MPLLTPIIAGFPLMIYYILYIYCKSWTSIGWQLVLQQIVCLVKAFLHPATVAGYIRDELRTNRQMTAMPE